MSLVCWILIHMHLSPTHSFVSRRTLSQDGAYVINNFRSGCSRRLAVCKSFDIAFGPTPLSRSLSLYQRMVNRTRNLRCHDLVGSLSIAARQFSYPSARGELVPIGCAKLPPTPLSTATEQRTFIDFHNTSAYVELESREPEALQTRRR